MIEKLSIAVKSRTVWTIVVMFLIGGIVGVKNMLPPAWVTLIDALLGILAIYFRVNPQATPAE